MTIYRVVSTTNKKGWNEYGRRMAEKFVQFWPEEIKLTVYAEDFDVDVVGVDQRSMPTWLARFKEQHGDQGWKCGRTHRGYDFRFDALKFSHKVAAITDFMDPHTEGVDIWCDADTLTHSRISSDWLDGLFADQHAYMAWLARRNSFPECGFVMYRTDHPYHQRMMREFRELYTKGRIFNMGEYHDSYLLMRLVQDACKIGRMTPPVSLSGDEGWSHPFVNGPLGAKMDHLKGPHRKQLGKSLPIDMRSRRNEDYWRSK